MDRYWAEAPASLNDLDDAEILGEHYGDVATQLAGIGIDPEDRVFWFIELPLSLIGHWGTDDPIEEEYVSELATAWIGTTPPPPILAVLHPPDGSGFVCTGLDGYRRIPAAERAGMNTIPAWVLTINAPFLRR